MSVNKNQKNVMGIPNLPELRRNQTYCINGHKFTEDNTYNVNNSRKYRMCKECHKLRMREYRNKKATND